MRGLSEEIIKNINKKKKKGGRERKRERERERGAERQASNASSGKPTWKRKVLQAASILRHSDGRLQSQLLVGIEDGSLRMVRIGPTPTIEAHTAAGPAPETSGSRDLWKNANTVVRKKNIRFSH